MIENAIMGRKMVPQSYVPGMQRTNVMA